MYTLARFYTVDPKKTCSNYGKKLRVSEHVRQLYMMSGSLSICIVGTKKLLAFTARISLLLKANVKCLIVSVYR